MMCMGENNDVFNMGSPSTEMLVFLVAFQGWCFKDRGICEWGYKCVDAAYTGTTVHP